MCSTPMGVNELETLLSLGERVQVHVLNAYGR